MKIESLTKEQELLIPKIRQEWIDRMSEPIDRRKAEAAICDLYEFAGFSKPSIAWVKSPVSAVLLLAVKKRLPENPFLGDSLRASLRASLGDSLGDSLWDSLRASLWASLRASLRASLWASLGDSLRASLRASLGDSLRASLRASLGDSLGDSLDSEWDCSWAAFFQAGNVIGVQFDRQKYDLFLNYCLNVGWIFPYENFAIACDRPKVRWNDAGEIHSDSAPAIEFEDGFRVWAIDGIRVPEKVVTEPHAQTIEEIQKEENEEIRRIRISRYGWHRYLREIGGSVVDTQKAPGGWMEALIKTSNYAVLCTYDPSTGRPYALEVGLECDSCEAAQRYLFAPDVAFEGLGLKPPETIETYPVIRT